MYRTTCPRCGAEDSLCVVAGAFTAAGMQLSKDGFCFSDASQCSTEDEIVECEICHAGFGLAELDADD